MADPIRVYIGAPPDGLDAESQMVSEHSLRKHASEPLLITWMVPSEDPASAMFGFDRSKWTTPFSGMRWAVPFIAGSGRAIYCDCDIICQGDISELWRLPLPARTVVAARGGWRYCVALFDCDLARSVMMPLTELKEADGHTKQSAFFRNHPQLTHGFGSTWNYLDDQDLGPLEEAKIIHYTSLRSQPSHHHAVARLKAEGRKHWNRRPVGRHPRAEITKLFEHALAEARAAGYTPEQYY